METLDVLIVGAIMLSLVFQSWLTLRVWKVDAYDRAQKVVQSKLIWLLPIAGPVVVYLVLRQVREEGRRP